MLGSTQCEYLPISFCVSLDIPDKPEVLSFVMKSVDRLFIPHENIYCLLSAFNEYLQNTFYGEIRTDIYLETEELLRRGI